jgi:hypothetical protein
MTAVDPSNLRIAALTSFPNVIGNARRRRRLYAADTGEQARKVSMAAQTWAQWQRDVVALLQRDFSGVLRDISFDEVDWPTWQKFFVQGRTPKSAIDHALERIP